MSKKDDAPKTEEKSSKTLKTVGVAAGIGSAALVAALLYSKSRKKKD